MPDNPPGAVVPHEYRADHAGPQYDHVLAACRDAVDLAGPHHVAHYIRGLLYLSADVLAATAAGATRPSGPGHPGHPDPAVGDAQVLDLARRRRDIETVGRGLYYSMASLNTSLTALESGPLIRAVFQARNAALLFFDIREDEYLVGFTLESNGTGPADRALATTVDERIRGTLGLGPRDPGGYQEAGHTGPGDDAGWLGDPGPSGPPFIDRRPNGDHGEDTFLAAATAAVNRNDLHYVAHFEEGKWQSSADVFTDNSLAPFFGRDVPPLRRAAYKRVGEDFQALGSTFDRSLRGVIGGRLERTVMDVEQGALYFYRTGPREYLMGVTLDQHRVHRAERRLAGLRDQLGSLAGGRTSSG